MTDQERVKVEPNPLMTMRIIHDMIDDIWKEMGK